MGKTNTQQAAESEVQAPAVTKQEATAASPTGNMSPLFLKAMSREELAAKTDAFIKENEGKRMIFGAVGRNGFIGEYVQRIDII